MSEDQPYYPTKEELAAGAKAFARAIEVRRQELAEHIARLEEERRELDMALAVFNRYSTPTKEGEK